MFIGNQVQDGCQSEDRRRPQGEWSESIHSGRIQAGQTLSLLHSLLLELRQQPRKERIDADSAKQFIQGPSGEFDEQGQRMLQVIAKGLGGCILAALSAYCHQHGLIRLMDVAMAGFLVNLPLEAWQIACHPCRKV